MSVRLHHLALRCADIERSVAFYSGVLGLEVLKRHLTDDGQLRSVWLRTGDAILMLERRLAGTGAEEGSGHLVAFAVDDLEDWQARLVKAGVTVDARSQWTLYFRDPDGHRVAVSTYQAPYP